MKGDFEIKQLPRSEFGDQYRHLFGGDGWHGKNGHSPECTCEYMTALRENRAALQRWKDAIQSERRAQLARGYDAEHDAQHGVDHLLAWAQDYARRGESVKSAALIEAARELLKVVSA